MNKQLEMNIIKFLSVVFNANNYPLPEKKINSIAKGIFKDDKFVSDILKEFVWSSEKYWINSVDILTPNNVINAIYSSIHKWNCSSNIWSLCILYNSQDEKCKFYDLLKRKCTKKHKNIFIDYIKQEITNVKEDNYADDGYKNVKLDKFIDYQHLLNYFRPFVGNACLERLFSVNRELNCIAWNEIIELLPHNFLKFLCNFRYHFYKKPLGYYLKQINKNGSDALVSLAVLNTISLINRCNDKNDKKYIKTGFKLIFKALQVLPPKRCFYWYGIILSNMGYCIARTGNTPVIFEDIAQKELLKLIKDIKENNPCLSNLKMGLKNTSRDCYLKHFVVFQKLIKDNKNLAIKLAKEIVTDYKSKVKSKDKYNLCFHSKHENDYCNAAISALLFLTQEKKINIYNFFNSLFKMVNVDKEDFNYSYSKLLDNKNKTLHIYIVALFVLQFLKSKRVNIKEKYVTQLIKKYFLYLHNFTTHFDQQEWFSLSNLLNLEIINKNEYINYEIDYLYNSDNPNFEILSFLLSKKMNYPHYPKVYNFINSYFHKYNAYWDIHKIDKWLKIWTWLKNLDNINICLAKLPKWKQDEYYKSVN